MKRSEQIEMGVHAVIASVMTEEEKAVLTKAEHIVDVCSGVKVDCEECFLYSVDCPSLTKSVEDFNKVKTGILSALVN